LKDNGQSKAAQRLNKEIQCAHSVYALAPDKIGSLKTSECKGHIQLLQKSGVAIPVCVFARHAALTMEDFMQAQAFDEVAAILRPWPIDSDPPLYAVDKPRLSCLLADCSGVDEESRVANQDGLLATINDGFFGDRFCDLFNTDDFSPPLLLATTIVRMYEVAKENALLNLATLPDFAVDSFDATMQACRAIIAITCPTPGMHEACISDVQKVWGGATADDYLLGGWSDMVSAIDSSELWLSMKQTMFEHTSAEDRLAPFIQECLCQLRQVTDVGHTVVSDAINLMTKHRSELRHGAFKPLDDLLLQMSSQCFSKTVDRATAKRLQDICWGLDQAGSDDQVKALAAKVGKLIKECDQSEAEQELASLATRPSYSFCFLLLMLTFSLCVEHVHGRHVGWICFA
jgi:hypothetical protein